MEDELKIPAAEWKAFQHDFLLAKIGNPEIALGRYFIMHHPDLAFELRRYSNLGVPPSHIPPPTIDQVIYCESNDKTALSLILDLIEIV